MLIILEEFYFTFGLETKFLQIALKEQFECTTFHIGRGQNSQIAVYCTNNGCADIKARGKCYLKRNCKMAPSPTQLARV